MANVKVMIKVIKKHKNDVKVQIKLEVLRSKIIGQCHHISNAKMKSRSMLGLKSKV